ncbi:MAG: putative manganese transporter [Bacteroidales bacterium]|jgi:hypothetical protein|nr:putative manganese transporter [Bacteroidales bacterium]
MMITLLNVLKNTLTITALVMVMMLLIEFVNVNSSGRWLARLKNRPLWQIVVAALLGLVPGCIGGFAIVSLFTHKMLSFGALVAGMITTFGDEAFVIFAYSPLWTLRLMLALTAVGMVVGLLTHWTIKNRTFNSRKSHPFKLHHAHDETPCDEELHHHITPQLSFRNVKNLSFQRALLLFGLIVYIVVMITGITEHEHSALPFEMAEKTAEHGGHIETVIFILLAFLVLGVVMLSSEHFLQSHLWEHVIKRHFLSVFLWTFGVLLLLHILYHFVDIHALVATHRWAMLAILFMAVLIGFIPESGPHLIFVVLFFNGTIPFSILLANSIVQDGHGALPLLAESRKSFLYMKLLSAAAGLITGLIGLGVGF